MPSAALDQLPASRPPRLLTAFERYAFRPAAEVLVRAFLPMPLGAIALTLVGVGLGIAGASLFRFTSRGYVVAGASMLVLCVVTNHAGARLAQVRGTTSRVGWIVNVLSDYVVGAAFAVTLAVHLGKLGQEHAAVLAGLGMASVLFQGLLFDYFRNRYLHYADPGSPNGNDLLETREALKELRRKRASAVVIVAHQLYALLRGAQEALARLPRAVKRVPFTAPPTERPGPAYADHLLIVARLWGLLSPSTHVVLLGVFAAAGALPYYIGLRLTLGNVLAVALFAEQHRREHRAPEAPFDPLVKPPAPPAEAPAAAAPVRAVATPLSLPPPGFEPVAAGSPARVASDSHPFFREDALDLLPPPSEPPPPPSGAPVAVAPEATSSLYDEIDLPAELGEGVTAVEGAAAAKRRKTQRY